jgi:RecB family exonuclease
LYYGLSRHLLMDHNLVAYTQDENLIKQRALKRQPFLTKEALEARLNTSFQTRQEVFKIMKVKKEIIP